MASAGDDGHPSFPAESPNVLAVGGPWHKSHSVRDKLRLFDRPTLVICGREDHIVVIALHHLNSDRFHIGKHFGKGSSRFVSEQFALMLSEKFRLSLPGSIGRHGEYSHEFTIDRIVQHSP